MKLSRVKLLFLALLLAFFSAKSQDIHFSQFYASPLFLSPANTGFFDGDWRIATNYRSQWKSIDGIPYETFSLSYDSQYFIYTEQINGGIFIVGDESGYENLRASKVFLSVSYKKNISDHVLYFGVQAGYVMKTTNYERYFFDSQYDIGNRSIFNRDLPNMEGNLKRSLSYPDLNLGAIWSKRLTQDLSAYAGMNIFHLNRPNESFGKLSGDKFNLPMRKVFFGGGDYKIGKRVSILPNILVMGQKKASDIMLGTNISYNYSGDKNRNIYAGPMIRYGWDNNTDAFIAVCGMKFNSYNVGISYDFNISGLKTATNTRGAFEISLIYISRNTKPEKIKIPCDRF